MKMTQTEQLRERIRSFIRETYPGSRRQTLRDRDSLLGRGIVDSVGILSLVEFLEVEFGITFATDDLVAQNFETIASIASFVQSKGGNG